jgi:hypothetical protein
MADFDASGLYEMLTYFGTNLENSKLNVFLESNEQNSAKAVAPFFIKT